MNNYLYAKESEKLQIPYAEYIALMERVEDEKRVRDVRISVLADLQSFLGGGEHAVPVNEPKPQAISKKTVTAEPEKTSEAEVVSVEFSAEHTESDKTRNSAASHKRVTTEMPQIPSIKKDIIQHFNKHDGSGRLFNVFKQYYTCLNNSCGGTVRVTMKDGFCSLWNYDEWEEFAFVDIYEGQLRIALDPRYTDEMKTLNLCESPRLLSSRRNVICLQVDDLNNVALDVLIKAFNEVGMQTK